MITIDEQIVWAKALIGCNSGIAPSVLASLERLKRIDAVQVPDEPEQLRYLRYAKDYYQVIEHIDTLRDLLKQCKHNSGVTMDELGEMRDRAEAAEAKLAEAKRLLVEAQKDAEALNKLFEYWESDDQKNFCKLMVDIRIASAIKEQK